jgi:HEPN domain-containing protein
MEAGVCDDEIFGFDAQQSVEKSLKAWLAYLGKEYPLTHDISALLDLLRSNGQDVEGYWDFVEYNLYAAPSDMSLFRFMMSLWRGRQLSNR